MWLPCFTIAFLFSFCSYPQWFHDTWGRTIRPWSHRSLTSLVCPILSVILYTVWSQLCHRQDHTLDLDTLKMASCSTLLSCEGFYPGPFVLCSLADLCSQSPRASCTAAHRTLTFSHEGHCKLHVYSRPHYYLFILSDFNWSESNKPLLGNQARHDGWSQGMW